MRIVQIINSLETGGAERLALALHQQYIYRGLSSKILTLAGDVRGWRASGVYSLGMDSPYGLSAPTLLADLPCEAAPENADVLHVHLFPSQLIAGLLSGIMPLPGCLVTSEHSTSNRRRGGGFGRIVDRWTYSNYERIICVSEAASEELASWIPCISDRIEVIPNGVELHDYPVRSMEDFYSPPVIVSAGRLVEAKNYPTALRIVSLLLGSGIECRYLIAGDGPMKAELLDLASELGIEHCVEFLGVVDDVPGFLGRGDIFLMPSLREGFGIAAVEAMASGLPVVASDVPGIGDVVGRDGRCGILAAPDSPGDMAEAVRRILEDPVLASSLRKNGSERASFFSIQRTAESHLSLFERILRRKTDAS